MLVAPPPPRRLLNAAVVLIAVLATVGCAPAGDRSASRTGPPSASAVASDRAARRTAAQLRTSIDSSHSGQQTVEPAVVLTDTSRRACTLQGVPTVSFVESASGGRIGPTGFRETMLQQPEVTLQPHRSVEADLIIDFPDKTAARCGEVAAAGLRLTLPGVRQPVFAAYSYPACRLKRLIAVFPVQLR